MFSTSVRVQDFVKACCVIGKLMQGRKPSFTQLCKETIKDKALLAKDHKLEDLIKFKINCIFNICFGAFT